VVLSPTATKQLNELRVSA